MTHDHKLTQYYFRASVKTIIKLEREGYKMIRHLEDDQYIALVTNIKQFEKRLEKVSETYI